VLLMASMCLDSNDRQSVRLWIIQSQSQSGVYDHHMENRIMGAIAYVGTVCLEVDH